MCNFVFYFDGHCIDIMALRDSDGKRFVSTVLLLLLFEDASDF